MHKIKNIPIQNDDLVNKEYVDNKVPSFWKGTLAEFNTAKANGESSRPLIIASAIRFPFFLPLQAMIILLSYYIIL